MNASRSKSRAKREKAPANPWRSLPRLATLFDETSPQTFFKGSKTQLEELTLTETQLLEQTAALLGVSLAQLIRAGTLMYAKLARPLRSAPWEAVAMLKQDCGVESMSPR